MRTCEEPGTGARLRGRWGRSPFRGAARAAVAVASLVLAAAAPGAAGVPAALRLRASPTAEPADSVEFEMEFPGGADVFLDAPESAWRTYGRVRCEIVLPADAPARCQALLHLMDWDYFWYQVLAPGYLKPGETNVVEVDVSPGAAGWGPVDHRGRWSLRALMGPRQVGLRVFSDAPYRGRGLVRGAGAFPARPDTAAPVITNVRVAGSRVPVYERFEIAFDLPDRYANPFDPDVVDARVEIVGPDGRSAVVPAFFMQDYERFVEATGDRVAARGAPGWRARVAPTAPGVHTFRLRVRDAQGEAEWGPETFEATAPRRPGFVRVSQRDPRFFEFGNGRHFRPIGHNLRSPYDARLDAQFPWKQRWIEGASAYDRYFDAMRKHGINATEIWSAAWSLGLEWSPRSRGYHGLGQYNLIHAWELDRVLEKAEACGVYVNLVIHNHGQFSLHWDSEWAFNPYNVQLGGYLSEPEAFFTHPRARSDFIKRMRYMIARWGYSTALMAWQLWSEVDLTGSRKDFSPESERPHYDPRVLEWHGAMGRAIRAMDPNGRLVSTHVCNDYRRQNPALCRVPEVAFCAVDAYHHSRDPLEIVRLLEGTARFNNPFGKPVLVTEFGGSPHGQDLPELRDGLHAGLWASACLALGGTPFFWWWQLIEEENLYPVFEAFARVVADEDPRGAEMRARPAAAAGVDAADACEAMSYGDTGRRIGWMYRPAAFRPGRGKRELAARAGTVTLSEVRDGRWRIEFFDTRTGLPFARRNATAEGGALRCDTPEFRGDVAFKARSVDAGNATDEGRE